MTKPASYTGQDRSAWWIAAAVGALLLPIVPNLILLFTADHSRFWIAQTATSILIALLPLLLGCRLRSALMVMSPFAAFMPFAATYAIATGFRPSLMAMQVLREATAEELLTFAPQLLLAAAIGVAILGWYWYLARRGASVATRLPRWARALGLTLLAVSLGKDIAMSGPKTGSEILLSRLESMQPVAPLALQAHILIKGGAVPDRSRLLREFSVTQEPVLQEREVCVLVIGESARKRAWGLYNPSLATTPRLQKRDLIVFSAATSAATVTFQSVPIILTGELPRPGEVLPFSRLGLVEAFRLAGFRTSWISMQHADGEISSLMTAFTANAQETAFLNGRLDRSQFRRGETEYDEALVGALQRTLAEQHEKSFIVLHTFGSHAPYWERYPKGFEQWPVAADTKSSLWHWLPPYTASQCEQLEHTYLNSVLYTDFVLDRLIATLEGAGGVSSLVYITDHGENDPTAKTMPAAHGVPTPDVLNAPFFIWLSPAYRARRPEAAASLARNAAKRVSATDVFATVCAMHDLRSPAVSTARSLANEDFTEGRENVVLLDGTIVPAPLGQDGPSRTKPGGADTATVSADAIGDAARNGLRP